MSEKTKETSRGMAKAGSGGIWFMGFLGTLMYFLHYHSGTLWLVLLAIFKAIFWPAYLVYYLLQFMSL